MANKRLKIFWSSNATFSFSGYGQAMADLLPRIKQDGYEVAISNFYGQAGGKFVDTHGILNYPVINHSFGSDAMLYHGQDFKADITLCLQDVWPLNPQDLQKIPRFIPWCPVDHDPIPKGITNNLRFASRIIAMSRFGQKQIANTGLTSIYIPHTVDTKVFRPLDKIERKKQVGLALDSYVVGMVAANKDNPPRKSFQQALDAFKLFLNRVPKALLYIHSDPNFPGGFPIHEYARFLGIQERVAFPAMDFPDIYKMKYNTGKEEMNAIYNTFDVLICPSTSEGFGVPIIEAQATGCPVVVNNFTAMPELIIPGITGEACEYATKIWSHMQSYTAIPDHNSLFDKMLKVYNYDKKKTRQATRLWIENNYDFEKTYQTRWAPFFEQLEREIYGLPVDNPQQMLDNKTVA